MKVLLVLCIASVAVGLAAYFSIKNEALFFGYVLGLVVGIVATLFQLGLIGGG